MMEVDSPFPKFSHDIRISPIPRRVLFDDDSPRLSTVQRRLFDESMSTDEINNNDPDSPPYKRSKSRRLFDASTPFGRTTPPSHESSLVVSSLTPRPRVRKRLTTMNRSLSTVPVNPFTPTGRDIVAENLKRKQTMRKSLLEVCKFETSKPCSDGEMDDRSTTGMTTRKSLLEVCDLETSKPGSDGDLDDRSIAGISLAELETTRFMEEFKVDCFIASGSFGSVYKCTNYLDGMEYAIKKTALPVAGTTSESYARREVFAHAALRAHRHIVAYFSSWIEEGHLFIQTEYCNGGSLDRLINQEKKVFTEYGLQRLANHVAKGLRHLHHNRLAHMDMKPSNVLVCHIETPLTSDEELDDADKDDVDTMYKIGDLGRVAVIDGGSKDVEEGDCRYMPMELLNEAYDELQKADIFSFGMTLLEAAGGGPLPKNGDEWQRLRNGEVPHLCRYSATFNQIIRGMLHPEPCKRPDIGTVLRNTRVAWDKMQQQRFALKVKTERSLMALRDSIPKIYVNHVD